MNPIIFGDDKLQATLEHENDTLWLTLLDKTSGKKWGKSRLAVADAYSKMELRTDTLEKLQLLQTEPTDDGVHVTLGDNFRGIAFALWLSIRDGELSIRVPMPEVYERKAVLYRLFAIDLLPGMMRVGSQGTMLLPLNTGISCSPAGKPKLSDAFLIYGEQHRWELLPMLPICAAHEPTGGMLALAVSGACDAQCRVNTDGQGSGDVGFAINLRQHWPDPVDPVTREFRYRPIAGNADPIHVSAKRLRKHVMEDLGKPTLKQRISETPALAYALSAFTMKLFYGIENQGIMMFGKEDGNPISFKRVMTFAQAGENLKRLHTAGVSRIYTQSVGWNPRGHDGLFPTRFPVEERLGGEAGFRSLIKLGQSLGFMMQVHDNQMMAVSASPDFKPDLLVHDIHGEPMITGCWGGGITYARSAAAHSDEEIERSNRQIQSLGIAGHFYLDGMGNPLYVNYNKARPGARSAYAASVNRFLDLGKRIFGSVGTECGFMYCALHADTIVTPGEIWHMKTCNPKWDITQLMEKRVPLWQLALHGLVSVECLDMSWTGVMRTILFGERPRTEWSAEPGIMPVLDDKMIARLKANYDLSVAKFSYLQLEEMTEHRFVADGVESTKYADGSEVVADFGKLELRVNGELFTKPAVFG